jgi:SpoVK/Ycf46/Vps4 family AAA+-type ATPase
MGGTFIGFILAGCASTIIDGLKWLFMFLIHFVCSDKFYCVDNEMHGILTQYIVTNRSRSSDREIDVVVNSTRCKLSIRRHWFNVPDSDGRLNRILVIVHSSMADSWSFDTNSGTGKDSKAELYYYQLFTWRYDSAKRFDAIETFLRATTLHTVSVFRPSCNSWKFSHQLSSRNFEQLFYDPELVKSITSETDWFFSTEGIEWSVKQAQPHRRGMLIHGPPGTGKTSFVVALASKYHRPIYELDGLASMSPKDLCSLIMSVPRGSIILMDEFDKSYTKISEPKKEGSKEADTISTADINHVLDSTTSYEGSLLIATANKTDCFPPGDPIRRSRRLNKWYNISLMSSFVLKTMISSLYGCDSLTTIDDNLLRRCSDKLSGADVFDQFEKTRGSNTESLIHLLMETGKQD